MSDALAPSRGPKTSQRGLPPWLALATVAMLACGTARAADFSIGAGAGVSRGKVDCLAASPCDRSDTNFKIFAGYQVTPEIDVRLGYFGGDPVSRAPTSRRSAPSSVARSRSAVWA